LILKTSARFEVPVAVSDCGHYCLVGHYAI